METITEQIEKFYKETGKRLEIKDGKPYYDGWFNLRGTAITSLPDNLVVGGDSLNLRETAITSLPDNLVVGGWLDLQGTAITSLPDNLVVGDWIELEGTQITDTSNVNRNAPTLYEWNNKKYIKVDGIFSIVDNYHGNVYKVHQIGSTKQMYVVGDGNGKWAHGETIDKVRSLLMVRKNCLI